MSEGSTTPNPYYKYHAFVCTNQRKELMACSDFDSQNMRDYLKQEMKRRDLYGEGKVRIGQAGCLGRCLSGPVMVVYPQGVWYTFVDQDDIDEIIESHFVNDQVVERLLIDPTS
ncbi:MAG: (2Fe-2S) ferredoxin domain-containing protein [Arenicellales bacterium]